MNELLIKKQKLRTLWKTNREIYRILKNADTLEEAREHIFDHLNLLEKEILFESNEHHNLEEINIKNCIRVLKNVFSPKNEKKTGESSLLYLWKVSKDGNGRHLRKLSIGFIEEFLHLFKGIKGKSGIYDSSETPEFLGKKGIEFAQIRSNNLDRLAENANRFIKRYRSGLSPYVKIGRKRNKTRIMKYFGISEDEWEDWKWHLGNVITGLKHFENLVELTPEETKSIELAEKYNMPFGVTPFYLSLMDKACHRKYDHAIRAQVIPPLEYVIFYIKHKRNFRNCADFMQERDTSPIKLVTRRYPEIAILKPYHSCFQICVYCQRNWEITSVLDKKAKSSKIGIEKAINWFKEHPNIIEILITGGDPFVLRDNELKFILEKISRLKHIQRIRFGTRTPVVLPFRITEGLLEILESYHIPGKREIMIVTHIEHPYEISEEMVSAIRKIKKRGISIYNQMVFTIENSRKFEAATLRRLLRIIGIDPYYTFVTKGKKEINKYRVPVARILQERKEEARLMGGMARTDVAVYNIPKLGKNYIANWQHHDVIMISSKGERYYEFHPWEKYITPVDTFIDKDIPIYEFLMDLKERGENINDYKTIWYYY